jgi:hypothetical protein
MDSYFVLHQGNVWQWVGHGSSEVQPDFGWSFREAGHVLRRMYQTLEDMALSNSGVCPHAKILIRSTICFPLKCQTSPAKSTQELRFWSHVTNIHIRFSWTPQFFSQLIRISWECHADITRIYNDIKWYIIIHTHIYIFIHIHIYVYLYNQCIQNQYHFFIDS